jgi:RNA polymerase sporulation-specific sigma factor
MKWTLALQKIIEKFRSFIGTQNRVDYVCGDGEALPLPLSPEEENACLREMATGEEWERERAKTELIQRNLRLVVFIARKFDNTGVENDDLISIGTIGLIKAINSFRTDKNIKLATYASRCIENEILMYLRRTARLKSEISFDEPLNTDFEGNELLLSDVLGTSADSVYGDIEANAEKQQLTEALKKLSDRERKIMFLRFGLGGGDEMTQKDVADLLGISQSYISRLEKKIILRLKKEIAKME